MESTAKVICTTVSGIVTALILGEVFGNVISRPIAAWKGSNINKSKLVEMLDLLHQRICDLEKEKGA